MSFFSTLRADRLITELKSKPGSPEAQRAAARLKDLGAAAIEPVVVALEDADKAAAVMLVDVLSALVTQKTFPQFVRWLVEGSPRVVAGVAWR